MGVGDTSPSRAKVASISSGNPKLSKLTAGVCAEISADSWFISDIGLVSSAWLFAKVASPIARHIFGGLMRPSVEFVNERNFFGGN